MNKPIDPKQPTRDRRAFVASRPAGLPPDVLQKEYKRNNSEVLDNSLQGFALVWLKSLPNAVKPLKCARHYPRVLNKIAALWNLNDRCLEFLTELLIDHRGTRQGFSYGVTAELRRLKAYRISLMPREATSTGFGPTEPMLLLDPRPSGH